MAETGNLNVENVKRLQQNDPNLFKARKYLREDADGLLMMKDRLYIPTNLRERVLQCFHKTHLGINKMMSLVSDSCYWPKMIDDIHDYVNKCVACSLAKPETNPIAAPIRELPEVTRPFQ